MNHSDPFVQKIKQTLDNEALDRELQHRLKSARHVALEQVKTSFISRYTTAAIAFTSLCVIALAITLSLSPSTLPDQINNIEVFEIITGNDSLEMYENLEFYLWLEEEFKV